MSDAPATPGAAPVFNADISQQLDKRMNDYLDKIGASEDPKAIAAAFRTLVEFSRPKPPQTVQFAEVSTNTSSVADQE